MGPTHVLIFNGVVPLGAVTGLAIAVTDCPRGFRTIVIYDHKLLFAKGERRSVTG